MTRNDALLSFMLVAYVASSSTVNAQLDGLLDLFGGGDEEEVVPEGGDNATETNIDDDGGALSGLTDAFEQIDEAVAELNISSLPDELADLVDIPTIGYEFGGSCIICDENHTMEGLIDNQLCDDWEVVAKLGIQQGSDLCNLLRVEAVKYCGCPIPVHNQDKTCNVCPEGEEPVPTERAFFDTLPVECTQLRAASAVDGDATCASISTKSEECGCQPAGNFKVESDSTSGAGSLRSQSMLLRPSILFLAVGLGYLF